MSVVGGERASLRCCWDFDRAEEEEGEEREWRLSIASLTSVKTSRIAIGAPSATIGNFWGAKRIARNIARTAPTIKCEIPEQSPVIASTARRYAVNQKSNSPGVFSSPNANVAGLGKKKEEV